MEQPVENVGALDDVAHEHEQRHRDQHLVGHDRVGALHEKVEDDVAHAEVAEAEPQRHQGEGDRKAQGDSEDEAAQ